MQFFLIFISLFVVLTVCYATEASSCEHGEFIRKSDDCRAYYRCVWGKKIKMKPCKAGLVFSLALKNCVWKGSLADDCDLESSDSSESLASSESAEKSESSESSKDSEEETERAVKSCKDIYMRQNSSSSGVYTIYSKASEPVSVFCDFYDDFGYTFVSKNDLGKLDDLSELYSVTDHAIVRILLRNSKQRDVRIEQLSSFKYRYPLSFQLSDAVGFQRPKNHNLDPYIYVGFLPAEYASIKSSKQGYRTAGYDVVFSNCDANPNSYFAFLANLENKPENPYYKRCCDKERMREWITRAQPIPDDRCMDDEFYYMYEIHMGGCGGYLTTGHTSDIINGAAVGLGFRL